MTGLPYYGPEGWPPEAQSMQCGIGSSEDELVVVEGSMTYKRDDDRWMHVTSRRPDDELFGIVRDRAARDLIVHTLRNASSEEWAVGLEVQWRQEAMAAPPPEWSTVVIVTGGRPINFELTRLGEYWAAVGRAPDVDIIMTGRNVPVPTTLIPVEGPPPMQFGRVPPSPRPARARRFPDDLLAPVALATIAEKRRVDLVYRDNQLTGTFGGAPVALTFEVPRSRSSVTGGLAGVALDGEWNLGDNSTTYPDVPGALTGTVAGEALTLSGTFHLDEWWCIEQATIEGALGDQAIAVRVEAIDGGLGGDCQTVGIEGSFAGTELGLFATISSDLAHGMLRGRVAGVDIQLDAIDTRRGDEGPRVVGAYQGPIPILALAAGTLLFFA